MRHRVPSSRPDVEYLQDPSHEIEAADRLERLKLLPYSGALGLFTTFSFFLYRGICNLQGSDTRTGALIAWVWFACELSFTGENKTVVSQTILY